MDTILGLDVGANSIGWTFLDNNKGEIIKTGVRIFPEGVENLGQGENEISNTASRRVARGVRRQLFRRQLRKKMLIKLLKRYEMCPADFAMGDGTIENTPAGQWVRMNPYALRSKALQEEISLLELGRICYHLAQRRGFQSNSRSNAEKDEGAIFDGKPKERKIGITETSKSIADSRTLGNYLYKLYPKEGEHYIDNERIRNRYTTRKMYIEEFQAIWKEQQKYAYLKDHSKKEEIRIALGGLKKGGDSTDGVLFYQRPLRSQKHLIGKCTLEPTKPRCFKSALIAEEVRIYQFTNNIQYNNEQIGEKERKEVVRLLLGHKSVSFSTIRKKLNKINPAYCEDAFNYKDNDKIAGSETIYNLSKKDLFGKAWFNLSTKEQEDIWHVLSFFDDRDKLKAYAQNNWGFTEVQAEAISKYNLVSGYANLSRKAMNNILPFLKQGYIYSTAVALGGVKNALGDTWEQLPETEQQWIIEGVEKIIKENKKRLEENGKGNYTDDVKSLLQRKYDTPTKDFKKLYHHSADITEQPIETKLPVGARSDKVIHNIKNPVVMTALFELRKLVNELIHSYGAPQKIAVELGRDLKVSRQARLDIRKKQQQLEKENNRIRAAVRSYNQNESPTNLLKYKLWEECDGESPYSGEKITCTALFNGGEVQVDHIIPFSRSLNNSFMNKTVCFADENREKGDKTPYEYFTAKGNWEEVKARAKTLFKKNYAKYNHFIREEIEDGFISRQLNDTRYIALEAKNYLRKICKDVRVSPGQATANLRHKWGLNSVLSETLTSTAGAENGNGAEIAISSGKDKTSKEKNRADHRHHAIDAIVVACTNANHLKELSLWNQYDRSYDLQDFPMPWDNFRADVRKSVEHLLVSHRQVKRLLTRRTTITKKNGREYTNTGLAARGALHKETAYGKRTIPQGSTAYHVRKPIESITTKKQINKIVDARIRKLILERIEVRQYEIDNQLRDCARDANNRPEEEKIRALEKALTKNKEIPPGTFFETHKDTAPTPMIKLPNRNGADVPVYKVRMREIIGKAEQLGNTNRYVDPRNNHHVLLYTDATGKQQESVVTFMEAVERGKQKQSIFQLPAEGEKVICVLQINDMFLLGISEEAIDWNAPNYAELSKHLYRVQTLSSKDYRFIKHTASQLEDPYDQKRIRSENVWRSLMPIKVQMSAAGVISKA